MDYRAAQELWQLMNRIATEERIHTSDVSEVMILIRKLLEASRARSTHRALALYCDWLLHDKINNPQHLRILLELGHFIEIHRDMRISRQALERAVGIPALRDDMLRLLSLYNIDTKICVDDVNWRAFVRLLFRKLMDYPIEFPFKQWWGLEHSSYRDLKKDLQSLSFLIPLRMKIVQDELLFLEITCDAPPKLGWVTDENQCLQLRVGLVL